MAGLMAKDLGVQLHGHDAELNESCCSRAMAVIQWFLREVDVDMKLDRLYSKIQGKLSLNPVSDCQPQANQER